MPGPRRSRIFGDPKAQGPQDIYKSNALIAGKETTNQGGAKTHHNANNKTQVPYPPMGNASYVETNYTGLPTAQNGDVKKQ